MRTTLDLPEDLISEARRITHLKTKTDVIIFALQNLIQSVKLEKIKEYKGKVKLDIDVDMLRKR